VISKKPTGFIDPELIPWLPEAGIEGLHAKTLTRCDETGSLTRLLKFLPGTDTTPAGTQAHSHLEEIWIVEGAIHDLTLDQNFVAGMYANRLHGMKHGPWKAPTGAVTFELRDIDPDRLVRKDQIEFFDPALLIWEGRDQKAGVSVKTLTRCPDTDSYARLVRFDPGAGGTDRLSRENGRSELWIVLGELVERSSGAVHPAGTYANIDIDLLDGSWTTPHGCTVLEIRNLI
jgi:ChrR Cupin-like domain